MERLNRHAVHRWARRGLAAMIVGLLLLSPPAIAAASSGGTGATSFRVLLERGDRGAAVKRVQRALHVRPVDGVFGARTERAVVRFQRRHNLPADGVVDPTTWRALGLGPFDQGAGQRRVRLPRVLIRIAQCESGGSPRAVSPSGRYRGKYQFLRATWRSLGGRGDPARAPEWLQDRLALRLYRRAGIAPWPVCGRRAVGR